MEARLYELIRDYQADRSATLGAPSAEFRESALEEFAARYPERYPEYNLADGRLARAVQLARRAGEIEPPESGHRDEHLRLRIDRDRAP